MATDDLQFDRAESTAPEQPALSCTVCKRAILDKYYTANGATVCDGCRQQLERELTAPNRQWPLAIALGVGAAILGAILYFGVTAITGYEIGLVAIAVGWLVGRAIQKGTGGRGGRGYQVAAVLLTYLSVAGAYSGLAVREMIGGAVQDTLAAAPAPDQDDPVGSEQTSTDSSAGDSVLAITPDVSAEQDADRTTTDDPSQPGGNAWLALAGLMLGLPIVSALGSLPGGLISLLILGIGLHQAWRMTGKLSIDLQGPFQVRQPGSPA